MTEDSLLGHAPVVRVVERPPIVHVRVTVVVDGRLRGTWRHVQGAYTLHPCDCHGEGAVVVEKPCPKKHDPSERYRNGNGWLACHACARDQNRRYASQRRAKAA